MLRALVLALGATAACARSAPAAGDLAAIGTHIGAHPAYVRVVVDFTDGVVTDGEVEAIDPRAMDGAVRIRVRHRNVQAQAPPARAAGVRAVVTGGHDRLDIRASSARRRFKYVQVSTLHAPERLVIDLYRSAPPTSAADIRSGRRGCLALAGVVPGHRAFRVTGRERDLFEHSFVLRARDRAGRVVGRRIMTAHGAWGTSIGYRVTSRQPGTLEAVADSAKDGSLACIAQVGVVLAP
jgi:Immunoglobulin-like domain of bacterial spore germination